jgi:DNA processing protein
MTTGLTETTEGACFSCLRRAWLVARLSGHIERAWVARRPLPAVLALSDVELLDALAGGQRTQLAAEYDRFDAEKATRVCQASRVTAVCRCDRRYPEQLLGLPDAPAVLHVHGDPLRFEQLVAAESVAVVGARRATPYGLAQARRIGRGLAAAGVCVVSGMALGVDSAAHAGALEAAGPTIAVLAGGPDRPYPPSKRQLHEALAARGAVVSELPPGARPHRWGFPARNRIIAALTRLTVVVEAGERSGSLITATFALELGRDVAAVPGLVTSPLAAGANGLIADGARLVRGPGDVLELLFGAERAVALQQPDRRASGLTTTLRALLDRVGAGEDTVAKLVAGGAELDTVVSGLAQLEMQGHLSRAAGGRYVCLS